MLKLKDWREVIYTDLPKSHPITDKTIQSIKERQGGLRVIMTGEDWDKQRAEIYKRFPDYDPAV